MNKKIVIFLISAIIYFSCDNKKADNIPNKKTTIAATIDRNIFLELDIIDSIIANQIYDLRINALEIISSSEIIKFEAIRRGISTQELIHDEIDTKSKIVTEEDIIEYIENLDSNKKINNQDIKNYLQLVNRKDRQTFFSDSLKNKLNYRVKLIPPHLEYINTDCIVSFDLNDNLSEKEVYIISDFECYSCQNAEKELNNLFSKYNNSVIFKFIYLSDYIMPDIYSACNAALKQNKFKEMHDVIFKNSTILHKDSIIFQLANEINLNMEEFNVDILNNSKFKNFIETKDYLLSEGIYSTPTFIVNNKIIDGKYAIDYLEDIIIKEFNINDKN